MDNSASLPSLKSTASNWINNILIKVHKRADNFKDGDCDDESQCMLEEKRTTRAELEMLHDAHRIPFPHDKITFLLLFE